MIKVWSITYICLAVLAQSGVAVHQIALVCDYHVVQCMTVPLQPSRAMGHVDFRILQRVFGRLVPILSGYWCPVSDLAFWVQVNV